LVDQLFDRGSFFHDVLCETKKADVVQHPEEFHHVGLLLNEPSGKRQVALQPVIRPILASNPAAEPQSLRGRA
jgi:hypothetical protein